jgi:hypothetical protein
MIQCLVIYDMVPSQGKIKVKFVQGFMVGLKNQLFLVFKYHPIGKKK